MGQPSSDLCDLGYPPVAPHSYGLLSADVHRLDFGPCSVCAKNGEARDPAVSFVAAAGEIGTGIQPSPAGRPFRALSAATIGIRDRVVSAIGDDRLLDSRLVRDERRQGHAATRRLDADLRPRCHDG